MACLKLHGIDKVSKHALLSRALSGYHPEEWTSGMEPLRKLRYTISNWRAAKRNWREEAPIAATVERARGPGAAYEAGLLVEAPRAPRLDYAIRRVREALAGELPAPLRAACEDWLERAEQPISELRALREKTGLTQVEFAERIGITANHLSRCERGESGISEPVLRMARIVAVES